jgi:SAM-dependent methyltransferase
MTGAGVIKKKLVGLASAVVARLPAQAVLTLAGEILGRRAATLPPRQALEMLLRLDARLYEMEGRYAIAHEGSHPKHRIMRYADYFVARTRRGERVLDIGCGRGELAFAMAGTGADVLGVDIEAAKVDAARVAHVRPNLRFAVADVCSQVPEGPYDTLVLSNVLEHLPNRPQLLAHLVAVTGATRLLIRVPLFDREWRVPLRKELGLEWRLDPTHETEYTLESFIAEVTGAGLLLVDHRICWGEIWAEARPATTDAAP